MDNKSFISQLSQNLDMDAKDTQRLVDTLIETITNAATNLDAVAIPSFGTFQAVKEDEKIVVTPDGHRMLMPPSVSVVFKESVVLRKKLKR